MTSDLRRLPIRPEPVVWLAMPNAPDGWRWTARLIGAVALATPHMWRRHVTPNAAAYAHRLRGQGFEATSRHHDVLYVRYHPTGDTDAT